MLPRCSDEWDVVAAFGTKFLSRVSTRVLRLSGSNSFAEEEAFLKHGNFEEQDDDSRKER